MSIPQTEYTNEEIQVVKLIETNRNSHINSLEIDNFVNNTFDLHNNTDYQLKVRITYNYGYYCWDPKIGQGDQIVDINARNFTRIGQGPPCGSFSGYHQNTIKLMFQDNNLTYQTYKTKEIPHEICKLCGDLNCLNDGEDCNKNSQCGGKYCVRENATTLKPAPITIVIARLTKYNALTTQAVYLEA